MVATTEEVGTTVEGLVVATVEVAVTLVVVAIVEAKANHLGEDMEEARMTLTLTTKNLKS